VVIRHSSLLLMVWIQISIRAGTLWVSPPPAPTHFLNSNTNKPSQPEHPAQRKTEHNLLSQIALGKASLVILPCRHPPETGEPTRRIIGPAHVHQPPDHAPQANMKKQTNEKDRAAQSESIQKHSNTTKVPATGFPLWDNPEKVLRRGHPADNRLPEFANMLRYPPAQKVLSHGFE
jgi:hypothetical protein